MVGGMHPVQVVLLLAVVGAVGTIVWRVLQWSQARAAASARAHETAAREVAALSRARTRPGADPRQPIDVQSAAAIEPRAEAAGCPWCDGNVHVVEHGARGDGGDRLRVVTLRCGSCGRTQVTYFRVQPAAIN